jgi:DNA-binding winged helix-turn-helix (wHTH) protein
MTATLTALLLQLSEGSARLLWGRVARRHYGPGFDRLLAAGVLTERPPAEEWSTCPHCDCGFDVRPIQRIGDRIVAACPFDASSDTELEEDDLRDFRIDPERLLALVARASGFAEPLEPLAPDLWRLGRLASGRCIVVGITAGALDHAGIVLLLKAIAGGGPITVLAPDPGPAIRLRFHEAGIALVDLRSALKASGHGVDAFEPMALEPVGPAARLVIKRRAREVTLDGRSVHLSEQLFALLLFLAERALDSPATVEIRAIEDCVWGASLHRIASSVRDPIRALREALAAGAADEAAARSTIVYKRNPNGYRISIGTEDIVIAG